MVNHAQKPENGPISDLFNLTPKYFLPLLPYSDLVPPSTDPVPPSANRPILTNYHYVSTITALYWSSTNKYQQVSPHTHPVPSCIASTAFYWPRTIMYQPVLPSTDPVPLYIDQYHSKLTQYHQVSTSTAFYWPNIIMYQPVPLHTDPVTSYINPYCSILTQYLHVSTSTAL